MSACPLILCIFYSSILEIMRIKEVLSMKDITSTDMTKTTEDRDETWHLMSCTTMPIKFDPLFLLNFFLIHFRKRTRRIRERQSDWKMTLEKPTSKRRSAEAFATSGCTTSSRSSLQAARQVPQWSLITTPTLFLWAEVRTEKPRINIDHNSTATKPESWTLTTTLTSCVLARHGPSSF